MKLEKFYQVFSQLPLVDRIKVFTTSKDGMASSTTLIDIYAQIVRLGNEIRPLVIEQNRLIKVAEKFMTNKKEI